MKIFFGKHELELEKLVAMCTEGCPFMTGNTGGFVSLLKKPLKYTKIL
jgi:hypothetical protein